MKPLLSHILVIASLLVFLSGCVLNKKYPNKWSEIVIKEGLCEKLTGKYQNQEIRNYFTHPMTSLMYQFGVNLPVDVDFQSIQTIKIECINEEKLIIIAKISDVEIINKTILLNEGGWRFEKGALYFPVKNEIQGDTLTGYASKTEFRLTVNVSGNLVGESRTGSVGLALWLIPYGGTQTVWYQWPRLETK